jgi:imidazolonepropionase-like amidohydrolase
LAAPIRSGRSRAARAALAVALGLGTALGLGAALAWWALAPPAPLALPPRGLVLEDVTLVNPGGARLAHRTLRVEGSTIAAIEAAGGGAAAGPWRAAFVVPGLVDMHVHFPPPTGLGQTELFALLFLAHGVTSVRDAGDADGTATAPARDGVREGRFPGPRVFACGPFVDGPEPLWPNSIVVRDAGEAAAAVERIAGAGFDCVKVYDGLEPAALAAVKAEAARHGLPVIGHVPRRVSWEEARLDDVQHLTGFGRIDGDLRPFPEPLGPWRDLDDAALAEIARRSAALGIAHTPTLVTGARLRATRDLAAAQRAPDALLLPRLYRDVVWTPSGSPLLARFGPAEYAILEVAGERSRRLVGLMQRAGVRLHAGSDTLNPFLVPGAALHGELRELIAAGLTPEEAWVAATRAPGEMLARRGLPGLGTLAPGAPADLLVFRDDPTRDLAALGALEAVVADGRLYPRAVLERELARRRAYAGGWLFDRISVSVARRMLARLFDDPPAH